MSAQIVKSQNPHDSIPSNGIRISFSRSVTSVTGSFNFLSKKLNKSKRSELL